MIYKDRPDTYYIPDNLQDGKIFGHIAARNLIETVAMEAVVYIIIKLLPVDIIAKVISGVIVMGIIGLIGIIGLKGESVTEFIVSAIKFRRNRKVMHFRRCDQREYGFAGEQKQEERQETRAEQYLRKIEGNVLDRISERKKDRERKNAGL